MCGLWGFVSTGGPADLAFLEELATLAAGRGPDGWGVAVLAPGVAGGRTVLTHHVAARLEHFGSLATRALATACAAIGHCRLATSGALATAQPLKCGETFFAHNGNVYNHAALKKRHKLRPETDCDSEILGLLVDKFDGPLGVRLEQAAAQADQKAPLAALALRGDELAVIARGHPLFAAYRPGGVYFCSIDFGGAEKIDGARQFYAPPSLIESPTPTPAKGSMPLHDVRWIPRDSIRPNDYNPNDMPPPEFRLLKVSILEDGWTQPIVVHRESGVIVDGEHRWTVAGDPEIGALTGGKVPVVYVGGDLNHRMMSTIRHNRARGEHGVLPMAQIVQALLARGVASEDVQFLLQMEDEEVDRLAERAGMPEVTARDGQGFGAAWVPGKE